MEFINSYAQLDEIFFERTSPVGVENPQLLLWNDSLAERLNLPDNLMQDTDKLGRIFSGNEMLDGFEPIALAYAGHQFGNFVPQLGDGRAHLLGELLDRDGIRRDIQLKGSGRTRFSRQGDGRCALGPALREYIMGEALYHLGVPTSRSLAVVATGESVYRERPLPGAVVTRVASSHIRVGTFEYFAEKGNVDALNMLVDYTINRHYPHLDIEFPDRNDAEGNYKRVIRFLESVIEKQIELVVEWMRIGFIHGVMNTDNTAVSGETIDFGPCAMMNRYDSNTVFSSIDNQGRYAFGNQPKIAQWNMVRFAECLLPVIIGKKEKEKGKSEFLKLIAEFPMRFENSWMSMLGRKIGLKKINPQDAELITNLLAKLTSEQADYTNSMNLLTNLMTQNIQRENFTPGEMEKVKLDSAGLMDWYTLWQNRLKLENESAENISSLMRRHNPVVIPRNHHVEAVIEEFQQTGSSDSAKSFLEVLRHPYIQMEDTSVYQDSPVDHDSNYMTFCGT